MDLDWNEFLLESIITLSKRVDIILMKGTSQKHSNAIYVSEKYKNDSFNSFLIKILTDEVNKGSFTSKVEMREWLIEKGLIESKLPAFLEGAKYFYVTDTGVKRTGDETQ